MTSFLVQNLYIHKSYSFFFLVKIQKLAFHSSDCPKKQEKTIMKKIIVSISKICFR